MKLFITNDAYLPGFRYGGPVRSLANLVDWLGERYEIFIFTKDRDLGDETSYPNIHVNEWISCGSAKVFYASPDQHAAARAQTEIVKIQPDVVYLNGLWERMTRNLLKRRIPNKGYVLAPRGALGVGALSIKRWKKMLGLRLMRPILKNLVWHAASESEAVEIQRIMGSKSAIYVAPNLLARSITDAFSKLPAERKADVTRLVSVSRLSRKKNFDYLLRSLQPVTGPLNLDIIGPAEDAAYLAELKALSQKLKDNQTVRFLGEKSPEALRKILPEYDFFVLPTKNENFGHVIIEAWAAGLPVVISDQTPWRELEAKAVGWDIPLSDTEKWKHVLEGCLQMNPEEILRMKQHAASFAVDLATNQPLDAYDRLFAAAQKLGNENKTTKGN